MSFPNCFIKNIYSTHTERTHALSVNPQYMQKVLNLMNNVLVNRSPFSKTGNGQKKCLQRTGDDKRRMDGGPKESQNVQQQGFPRGHPP
jgi:hypothetical protein